METTVSMKTEIYEELGRYAVQYGLKSQELVRLCIRKLYKKIKKQSYTVSTVQYQEKHDSWHTYHLSLNEMMYEKSFCLKHVYKLSFSFLVAIALELFLENLFFEDDVKILEILDSYQKADFFIDLFMTKKGSLYSFYWKTE